MADELYLDRIEEKVKDEIWRLSVNREKEN
jgi:hypothetical protein